MKTREIFQKEKEHTENLIDIKGLKDGRVTISIAGKKLDDIYLEKQFQGLPNKKETKKAATLQALSRVSKSKIDELMRIVPPEKLVHLFLNYGEYKRMAEMTEENLDSDPHNKIALANKIIEKIVEPYGLEFHVKSKIIGVDIEIGIKGNNYHLN